MSTSPVTLMVARRVADGRYQDLIAWLREGEQLATDFPGYLGSGVLAPPPDDNEFQIIFRFADEQTLHAWEHSASRTAWLARAACPSDGTSGQWHRRLVWRRRPTPTTLETGGGDLAGVLSGVAAVQLCSWTVAE
jgi:antibiotic biosynthesis monooxygenase (ABM) superfamily enzyme